MVATTVEETATSVGGSQTRRHNNTRKRVDPSRPKCWQCHWREDLSCDLHNARSGSVKLGQTTRATLCSCTGRAGSFCHPCFGSATQPTLPPTLAPQTVTPASCSRICARPRHLVLWDKSVASASATSACLRFTLAMQSVQLAQCAASALPQIHWDSSCPSRVC